MAQSMEQRRAAFAWEQSGHGIAQASDKYTKLAKGAPALIMNSGLMQTLAFFSDKGESQHKALLDHLLRWIAVCFNGESTNSTQHSFPRGDRADFGATMQALFHAKPQQYQRATAEAMMILRWIRQMAAAR